MSNAPRNSPARRARSLRVVGLVCLLAAVLFLFAAGWVPAAALVVLGLGNLLAAGPVGSTGVAPVWTRAMIIVGGVGFVVSIVITTIVLVVTDS